MAKRTRAAPEPRPKHPTRPLGVIVVDPLAVVRAGLIMLIEERPDMEVLAEAGSAGECIDVVKRLRRSRIVVLVGLGLNGERDAYWLIREVRERLPGAAVLACGAHAEARAISRALFVGADGYVDKGADPKDFLKAIRTSARGEMVLVGPPLDWVGAIAEDLEREGNVVLPLTGREREVLSAAAEGLTAREIAQRLAVAERTVTTHLGRIYGKLGVNSRLGAVLRAARSGLVRIGSEE